VKFDEYAAAHSFVPWITSLLDNHYHTIGYLKAGENLGPMMRKLHGSVAKLVNDQLPERLTPFWYDTGKQGYFDGCLRDEVQGDRTYRYIQRQSVRHGLATDWRTYPHTRVNVDKDRGIARATQLNAWMRNVRYKRYDA
jgi:hypothetical protein